MVQSAVGTELSPLVPTGHVLVVTAYYPPIPGGSSVIMRNLLSHFHPSSYSVVTARGSARQAIETNQVAKVHKIIFSCRGLSYRLDTLWCDWQVKSAVGKLVRLIEHTRPSAIVGVYPNFHFLKIAREASRITQVPLLAYLHDTIAEGLADTRWAARAIELQEQVFDEASSILVMSRGMADLYEKKYGLSCQPLEHTYSEPIPELLPQTRTQQQGFWGGDIYSINARSVMRVSEALQRMNYPFLLATRMTTKHLKKQGVIGDHLRTSFYSNRVEYLNTLKQQDILILALDWPDESPKHIDELATIFPTKAPEYLASGRPILVHCPENYFLARFFREHHCGLVVAERSVDALERAVQGLLKDSLQADTMRKSALTAAQLFSADRLASRFQMTVQSVARC